MLSATLVTGCDNLVASLKFDHRGGPVSRLKDDQCDNRNARAHWKAHFSKDRAPSN